MFTTVLYSQIEQLTQNYDVVLISGKDEGMKEFQEKYNVIFYKISMARGVSPAKDFYSILRFLYFCLKNKPDIVHSFTPKGGLVGTLGGCFSLVPVRIHTFTGLVFPSKTGLKKLILVWIDRLLIRCSTHVIAESATIKKELEKVASNSRRNIDIVGNGNIAGVDVNYYSRSALSSEPSLQSLSNSFVEFSREESFNFIYIGRINKDKGIHELVNAFMSIKQKTLKPIRLIVVGRFDEILKINPDVKRLIINDRSIVHLGHVPSEEVRKALYISHVFILPSYREGFSNSILQAASMEVPCIATKVSGSIELIEHGTHGWLVDIGSQGQLETAMLEALSMDSTNLAKIGCTLRKKVTSLYNSEDYFEFLKKYYSDCVNNQPKT